MDGDTTARDLLRTWKSGMGNSVVIEDRETATGVYHDLFAQGYPVVFIEGAKGFEVRFTKSHEMFYADIPTPEAADEETRPPKFNDRRAWFGSDLFRNDVEED